MKNYFLICFLLIIGFNTSAQVYTLSGKVVDEQQKVIPFATVFVKGSTNGSAANGSGEYLLKVASGKSDIIFSAIGFKQSSQSVIVKQNTTLNVVMSTELYSLDDVIVYADREDPAYQIIRKTIKERKKYLKESPAYTCEVYIKGVQRLLKTPEKFLGRDLNKVAQEAGLDSNRTGIIYQSESQSKFSFMPPKSFHEEMISSKVAGSNRSFSFNRASDLILNFYENYQEWKGLSNRPFVSPVADNALFYYDYKLIGTSVENGELINKIQLLPKRKYDPAYRGYIYIVDDSWRIHSVDFLMSKESNIAILDSLKIKQQFIAVNRKTWMPSNIKLEFSGGFLGFKFGGYYVGVYSNYDFKPNLKSADFKELLRITKEVNKKDSTFWETARPIPLTSEETLNYTKKDSIATLRLSKPYLDSLDKVNNKLKFSNILLSGYSPRNRFKRESFKIDGLIPSVLYNTVEGFAVNYGASFTKRVDTLNNRSFFWKGNVRYGLANKLFNANTQTTIPIGKISSLSLSLGSDMSDLNNNGSMSVMGNTLNSLIYQRNYMKLYQRKFGEATITSRLLGGLNGSFGLDYNSNNWVPNSSNYSFEFYDDRTLSSNNPFFPTIDQSVFQKYQSFKLRIGLSYNFSNKYVTYPSGKFYLPSKWPVISFKYIKAIPGFFGSDVDYDFLSFGIRKSDIKFGFYGNFSFSAEAGKFISSKNIYFPDFKHFNGNRALSFTPDPNQFLFLDYYLQSTPEKYFEAHAEHNFSGFFTNKIPLIRKLKLQELIGVNYLKTPTFKNYSEFYFGLSYTGIKVFYGISYENRQQVKSGFRIVSPF